MESGHGQTQKRDRQKGGEDNEIGGFSRREGGCLASHGEFYILDY